ncbi:MAG: hypothetical protein H5T69_10720 [Chloroflexi bacterium]|nr:hypothetical protein [Chloroflexota bacterium]
MWLFVVFAVVSLFVGCQARVVTKEVPVEVTREVEKVVTQEVTVEVTRVVEKEVPVEVPKEPSGDIPFAADWVASAHADTKAEAFTHWDEDDPPVVPKSCAKCHSTFGFQDFLGVDGSAFGVVDQDAKIGSVITCVACHNTVTWNLDSVEFPSGAVVEDLGPEARCMQCHQGRASTVQVNASIEKAGVADPDAVSPDLGFTNIHYFAAAATQMGTLAQGGYQYEGKAYDARFAHVEDFDTCVECHNPHTLKVQLTSCQTCHENVQTVEDIQGVRMAGSQVDYDGDGDIREGIYHEIQGLRTLLYEAIRSYGASVAGTAIAYNEHAHPYFFIDTNQNGVAEETEATSQNRYNAWTPRLAKAAYNYQTSLKDPGAFAHGGKYIIQLLYDSIEDLNQALSTPIDLSKARRIDAGHFAGSEEAFRHWDKEGKVPGSCSKCHSAAGLPLFLSQGVSINQEPANGFECSTCHNSLTEFTRYEAKQVQFPSGAVIDSGDPNTNLCMNCHQGRESTVSVNRLVEGLPEDSTSEKLRFLNVHYFAAGATLFGGDAQGAYQYAGKSYAGRNEHVSAFNDCTECHTTHGLTVKVEGCANCHEGVKAVEDLRRLKAPDAGEGEAPVGERIETMEQRLYAAIQEYAQNVVGTGIVYDAHVYPYFFVDKNGNRALDEGEAAFQNQYNAWTPRLLRAAYNYQYVQKDPGAFAHNGLYISQVLYDSLQDLSTRVSVDLADLEREEKD